MRAALSLLAKDEADFEKTIRSIPADLILQARGRFEVSALEFEYLATVLRTAYEKIAT